MPSATLGASGALAFLFATVLSPVPLAWAAPAAATAPVSTFADRADRDPVGGGDTLERGVGGFVAHPRGRVDLSSTSTSRTGRRALRVRTSRPLVVRVMPSAAGAARVRPGLDLVADAWVRPVRHGQVVTLVVREVRRGHLLQRRTTALRLQPGRWTRLRTRLTTRHRDVSVRVRIVVARSARPVDLLVDDVALARQDAQPMEPTQPAEPPGPSGPSGPSGPTEPTEPTDPDPTDPSGPQPLPAGALTNGCTYSARGLPACGAYLGATYGGNTDPAVLESAVGRRLGVRRTFWRADQVASAVRTAGTDVSRGRLPWISFKLPHSWEDMTAGRGDAWARDLATRLAAVPGPVWVAFHHEPEGDGDVQAWRTMQERLAPLVRRHAPNVAFTVVLTGWNQFYGSSAYSLGALWPRGVKIDVAGFDLYNEYGVVKNGRKITRWPDFDTEYFAKIQAWAATHDVAWGVAETAYTDEGHAHDADWIEKTYDRLVARGGTAMAYFDTELNAYGSWALSTASKRADLAAPLQDSAALPVT